MKETTEEATFSRPFTRRDFLSTSLKASAAAFTTGLLPKHFASAEGHYNVLLIMVDDLRPLLGCYGHQEMHTPNIDRLAQRGTLFDRAYCQYPLCSPSRTSIITGLRPQTTGVLNNRDYFRETVPQAVTLPQHFKSHGYYTQSVGRIFHTPDFQDDENSWSAPSWRPPWYPLDYETTPSWKALDVEDDNLKDGQVAKRAVEVLEQIKNQHFFLAVGFFKPHLPYNAPKKYFELYENKNFNLPALSGEPPSGIVPPNWNEIRPYADIPPGMTSLSYEKILELTRAYAAATSYTDAQIGRVLDQLDSLGLAEKTVIAFCGDHGYNLGEDGTWGKNIIVETALRSPMIISIPGQAASGEKTQALVELVDIYPTLCDACRLPILPELEGLSMLPVIQEPTLAWKKGAFSQLKQGHSIRTERYRYTEWGQLRELYDFNIDPYSDYNIVDLPENAELVAQLSEQLKAGWRGALPDMHDHPNVPLNKKWDINSDGIVDIQDLILISNNFGKSSLENPKVDVNRDGRVDIIDLLIVAAHFTQSNNTAAPSKHTAVLLKHVDRIEEWLAEARTVNTDTDIYQRGITALEALMNSVIPEKTILLPNYPNPFNPETWIPYDLAQDTEVHIHIYNLKGETIRHLNLGFQTAGTYRTQSRAAHWDGQNSIGEPVASGVYFYTLSAGQTKTTRKMVIRK